MGRPKTEGTSVKIRVSPEFNNYLEREMERLRHELESVFGIKVTKPKVTKYLIKKIEENGGFKGNGFF